MFNMALFSVRLTAAVAGPPCFCYHVLMEPNQTDQLSRLEEKVDAMHKTVKDLKFYFVLMVVISVGAVVLPLVGLVFAIPAFMDTMSIYTESGLL